MVDHLPPCFPVSIPRDASAARENVNPRNFQTETLPARAARFQRALDKAGGSENKPRQEVSLREGQLRLILETCLCHRKIDKHTTGRMRGARECQSAKF